MTIRSRGVAGDENDDLERRRIELEEQLLNLQERRLDIEQKRIELELRKLDLATRSDTSGRSSHKSKKVLVRSSSRRSDDDEPPSTSSQNLGRRRSLEMEASMNHLTETTATDSTKSMSSSSDDENETETKIPSAPTDVVEGGSTEPKSIKALIREESQAVIIEEQAPERNHAMESEETTKPESKFPTVSESQRQIAHQQGRRVSEPHNSAQTQQPAVDRRDMAKGRRAASVRDIRSPAATNARRDSRRSTSPTMRRSGVGSSAVARRFQQQQRPEVDNYSISSTKTTKVSNTATAKKLSHDTPAPAIKEVAINTASSTSLGSSSASERRTGFYVYNWPDGRQYSGGWLDGKFHGKGTYSWPNGGKYVGSYKHGLKHGSGVYVWADGNQYDGEFKNGKREGRGVQLNDDKTIFHSGLWKEDEPAGLE